MKDSKLNEINLPKLLNAIQTCKETTHIDSDILGLIMRMETPKHEYVKCTLACTFKKLDLMFKNNSVKVNDLIPVLKLFELPLNTGQINSLVRYCGKPSMGKIYTYRRSRYPGTFSYDDSESEPDKNDSNNYTLSQNYSDDSKPSENSSNESKTTSEDSSNESKPSENSSDERKSSPVSSDERKSSPVSSDESKSSPVNSDKSKPSPVSSDKSKPSPVSFIERKHVSFIESKPIPNKSKNKISYNSFNKTKSSQNNSNKNKPSPISFNKRRQKNSNKSKFRRISFNERQYWPAFVKKSECEEIDEFFTCFNIVRDAWGYL